MSKRTLYRLPADANPVRLDKQPKDPLSFVFPLTNEDESPISLFGLLTRITMIYFAVIFIPITLNAFGTPLPFLAIAICYILVRHVQESYGRVATSRLFTIFLLSYGLFLLSHRVNPNAGSVLLFAAIGFVVYTAANFRRHWEHRACCGMLSKKIINDFQQHGKLPAGIRPKPTFQAFAAAMNSWLSYDPTDSKVKGVMKSPAGYTPKRIANLIGLVILLAAAGLTPQGTRLLYIARAIHPLAPLVYISLPVTLPLLAIFVASSSILGKAHALIEYQFHPELWSNFVAERQAASKPDENKSVYLGRVWSDGSPILYPAENFTRGAWIQGGTGSGKTLLLMQIMEQLIELGYSLVVLDMKGLSHELLAACYAAAARVHARHFRHVPITPFTSANDQATYLFNLLEQPFWYSLSPEEKAGLMLGFFGINSSEGPDVYFRDASWTVSQHLTSKYPNLSSFHEAGMKLALELKHAREPYELSAQSKKYGEHPRMIIRRLGLSDALNTRPTYTKDILDQSINLETLFEVPSVLYCSLPSVTDPTGNPEIGRVMLSSLLATASHMKHRPVKTFVICDEFQRCVSRSVDLVIQQCRSMGMGLILSNQTTSDLAAIDPGIIHTLAGNTNLQAWLQTNDQFGEEQLQHFGGQYISHMLSQSVSSNSQGESVRNTVSEHVLDRVSSGLIDEVNSTSDSFFLRVNSNAGYAAYGGQMMVAKSGFHTATKDEYEDRIRFPWPTVNRGMLVNGQHRPRNGPPDSLLLGPTPPNTIDSQDYTQLGGTTP